MLMVRKIVLSIVALLAVGFAAYAQTRQVSGTVKDEAGNAIVGASVVVDGTVNGATTAADGSFKISAPANATLTVSFIGYEDQSVNIAGKTQLAIVMNENAESIDDVVVMGYGSGRKVGTVIGSVESVKAEKFENRPSNNVMDAMQGQVAGLQIISGNGEPDATSTIRLHGVGSMNAGNEPLILLDGAPITTGTLLAMNQNDIASINVLKDASATSIYGSRAANGVIYVTTKKGNFNEDVTVTLRTQYSMSSATKPRVTAMNTEQLIDYTSRVYTILNEMDPNDPDQLKFVRDYYVKANRIDESIDTKWFDVIMHDNAPLYQVDLGVSGGTRKSSYYFSANYADQQGILPSSDMTRYTFRGSVETRIKDWIKSGISMGVGFHKSNNAFTLGSSDTNWFTNPVNAITFVPSFQNPYDEEGNPLQILNHAGGYASPLVLGDLFASTKERLQLNGAMFLELTPAKGLTIRTNLAANAFDYKSSSLNSPDYYYNEGEGSVSNGFQRNYDWTWTNTAEYKTSFADMHHISVLLGHETIYGTTEFTSFRVKGLTDSRFPYPSMGTETSGVPTYTFGEYAYNSVFGRVEYDYAEKYFVDFSVRNDASSRFAPSNRNAAFWSAGAMWNLKKEAFLADSEAVDRLSAKISYGTQGNSGIGDYRHYAAMGPALYNGKSGWNLSQIGSPDLGWETQKTLTVGVEVGFLNKLRLNIEWYRRQTADMLTEVPIPGTTGFTSEWINVGGMRNSGIDLSFNYDIYRDRNWFVNFHANFNYNKNQITEMWDGLTEYALDEASIMSIGDPYYNHYMQHWVGVDTETGVGMWATADGGVTPDPNEAAFFNTGKSWQAPYSGGFGVNVMWKGLSLVADFSWVHGNYLYNNSLYFTENPLFVNWNRNQTTGALDYWRQPGDDAKYASLESSIAYGGRNFNGDDLLESGSFLRLKNIQLAYSMPAKWFAKTKFIEGIRVYVGARNLWTVTGYTGLDPEIDSSLSLDNYPASRQWTFGAEFKF